MELGKPGKKKKRQESEVERCKRIERVRTRHELIHLVLNGKHFSSIF